MSNFPSSVSTNANLYIAVNGLQTTLASTITAFDTTITLTSSSGFPTTGYVTIENNEVVSYTGISGAQLTGCTRGADGTTALGHSTGVTVGLTIVAAHHNLLKDEVIAIETALGAGFAKGNISAASSKITVTGGTGAVIGSGVTVDIGTLNLSQLSDVQLLSLATNDLLLWNGTKWVNFPSSTSATASTMATRDASANLKVNAIVENFATTATAAGTTVLSASTSPIQQFTGTTTQTVTLPDATTLTTGFQITILNRSTGIVTVNNKGGVLQQSMAASTQTTFTCTNTGSSNGTWDVSTSSGGGSSTAYREDYVVGTALNNYTGSTTVFNLVNAYTPGNHTLIVTLDGDVQTLGAGIDYLETNTTTVTFNNALVSGQKVSFIFQVPITSGGTVNSGTAGQVAKYATTGTSVSGSSILSESASGLLVTASNPDITVKDIATGYALLQASTNGTAHRTWVGTESSSGGALVPASTGYSSVVGSVAADPLLLITNDTTRVNITTTNITTNLPTAIQGTSTNDSASSGYVGEYIASTLVNGNAFGTGVWGDSTSISLPAGDWDITASYNSEPNGAGGLQNAELGISTSSGNTSSGLTDGLNWHYEAWNSGIRGNVGMTVANYRLSIASTTTVYMKMRMTYTSGTPRITGGNIRARRVR